jgi:CDP-paratose 2-epimerase
VHINRCGVLAGAGQFGKADQGIFSFWIHSYRARRPMKYIGFEGRVISSGIAFIRPI